MASDVTQDLVKWSDNSILGENQSFLFALIVFFLCFAIKSMKIRKLKV